MEFVRESRLVGGGVFYEIVMLFFCIFIVDFGLLILFGLKLGRFCGIIMFLKVVSVEFYIIGNWKEDKLLRLVIEKLI